MKFRELRRIKQAATPEGMKVWCESEVIEVDRRKITFKVVVYDADGIVGQGTHERFIIDEKKFGEKMNAKQHS